MIDQSVFEYINTNWTFPGTLRFGSAESTATPYVVLLKVSDLEQPETMCEEQGEVGEALFQFTGYAGQSDPSNMSLCALYLEEIKNFVASIIGDIGDYIIQDNRTGGVRQIGDATNDLQIYSAFFESTLKWNKK